MIIDKAIHAKGFDLLESFKAQRTEIDQDAARAQSVLDIKRRELVASGPGSKKYNELKASLSGMAAAAALGEVEDVDAAARLREKIAEVEVLPAVVEALEVRVSEIRGKTTTVDHEINKLHLQILHDEVERLGGIYAQAGVAVASAYRDMAAVAAKLSQVGYPVGRFDGEGFGLPAFTIDAHRELTGVGGQLSVAADIRAGGEFLARQDAEKVTSILTATQAS